MLTSLSKVDFDFAGYGTVRSSVQSVTAISDEAFAVCHTIAEIAKEGERSEALFGIRVAAIDDLRELAHECAERGWDGEDAAPIGPEAVYLAERFVRAMPENLPLPEFAPEPDGAISLDWMQSSRRIFTVSIGTRNRLAYAWIDGSEKGHAVAYFDGDRVPRRILEGIRAVMDHGNASFRTA